MDFSVQLQLSTFEQSNDYFSNNNINPGLGQFVQLYSNYVPLHSRGKYEIEKKLTEEKSTDEEISEQEGMGNSDLSQEQEKNGSESLKRKMDNSVLKSFLHPNINPNLIKTSSFKVPKSTPKKMKIDQPEQTGGKKCVSKLTTHKFQFF